MNGRDINPKKKNHVFRILVIAAIVVAIAGIWVSYHVDETTHDHNVPGQKLK